MAPRTLAVAAVLSTSACWTHTEAQPPSPIAPHAVLRETVFVEHFLDSEDLEATIAKAGNHATGVDRSTIVRLRRQRDKLLDGGQLYLVIVTSDGKHTWRGVVRQMREPTEATTAEASD